ncbi:hypothetical protein [Chondromyces apiculatus]|uniref:Uncharacterized protein n=1 Tax=Chondromyces apiculatus DSM 436 TaxID=1192034 RepID=A0A017TI37_9BACT|nr:hypothetical protein [Chondromyces apiculatus]EYF08919.1 Hypothetical protein CAP_0003 [Chondromyces apiculatus DSM 436]
MTPDDISRRSRQIERKVVSTVASGLITGFIFATVGTLFGRWGMLIGGGLSGGLVMMRGGREVLRRMRSLATDVLNTSFNLIALGHLGEADALLDWIEAKPRFVWVERLVDIQRAIIGLRRGDLAVAHARIESALSRPVGGHARENALQQIEGARALRALVRAGLGRPEGAREDIAYVRGGAAPSETALAKVALAEAMILERAGEREALRKLLEEERDLLLEHTHPRERAIVRAYQRMLRSARSSVYRQGAAQVRREATLDEPTLADWVARVAPGAAPFVRAGMRDTQASTTAVEAALGPPGASGAARRAVMAAREEAAAARRRARLQSMTTLALGVGGVTLMCAVFLEKVVKSVVMGDRYDASSWLASEWVLYLAPLLILAVMLYRGAHRRKPQAKGAWRSTDEERSGSRARGGNEARGAGEARGAVARGEEGPRRRVRVGPDEATLRTIAEQGTGVEAAQAHLRLALEAERRADFEAALAHATRGMGRLVDPRTRAASDVVFPDLVSLRAFALAACDRGQEAEAEIGTLGARYPDHARSVFRVRLMQRVREGDLAAAAAWVAQGETDLPLSVREEMLADLTLAAAAPDRVGAGELFRIRDELRTAPELRHWIEVAAPGVLRALEGGHVQGAEREAEGEAEREAEGEAEREAEEMVQAPRRELSRLG